MGVLILTELGIRLVEPSLSLDVRHVQSIPHIIARVASGPSPRILFLGNSLTRRGVDLSIIRSELAPIGVEGESVDAVFPDDTRVLDWIWLYKHEVADPGFVPDVLVVGFAIDQVADAPVLPVQTLRLGRYFTSWSDLPILFRQDVTSLGDRVNVLLAKLSHAFANRERVNARVLHFLPGYEVSSRRINDAMSTVEPSNGTITDGPAPYADLDRFLLQVSATGAHVVLVAMPTAAGYHLDSRISSIARSNRASFIDARYVPGLTADQYLDGLHLDPAGSRRYSSFLAPILSTILQSLDVR